MRPIEGCEEWLFKQVRREYRVVVSGCVYSPVGDELCVANGGGLALQSGGGTGRVMEELV